MDRWHRPRKRCGNPPPASTRRQRREAKRAGERKARTERDPPAVAATGEEGPRGVTIVPVRGGEAGCQPPP